MCSRCGARQKPVGTAAVSSPSAYAAAAPQHALSSDAGAVYQAAGAVHTTGSTYVAPPMYAPTVPLFRGYGGFWIRVVAALIDSAVTGVVLFPLMFLVIGLSAAAGGAAPRAASEALGAVMLLVLLPLMVGVPWVYSAAMESSKYQGTLGKMALGLKVTDGYGNRISFGRATGRHFAKIISGMILNIGYIMVGLTERKQGLHDMLASTLVVKK
ncbi:MAG TPA: RDD family protein [Terriglobales bacterium]|nr:RDD family protein [Terriglobales bacterium]